MMRTLTRDELDGVLRKHTLWVRGMEGGERADLRGANLHIADLRNVNLSEADLSGTDLSGANMREANLREANLREADLRNADLSDADLCEANLSGANLSGAALIRADLKETYLYRADLRGANLHNADLRNVNLSEADLSGTDLSGARNVPYILPLACPEEGAFIGFKKAYNDQIGHQPVIVKLLILEDAKRSSATTNKCRCSKAKVLDIQDILGNSVNIVAYSKFNPAFVYKIGEIVEVKDFDENRFNECAPGIHFFINRQDAINY